MNWSDQLLEWEVGGQSLNKPFDGLWRLGLDEFPDSSLQNASRIEMGSAFWVIRTRKGSGESLTKSWHQGFRRIRVGKGGECCEKGTPHCPIGIGVNRVFAKRLLKHRATFVE